MTKIGKFLILIIGFLLAGGCGPLPLVWLTPPPYLQQPFQKGEKIFIGIRGGYPGIKLSSSGGKGFFIQSYAGYGYISKWLQTNTHLSAGHINTAGDSLGKWGFHQKHREFSLQWTVETGLHFPEKQPIKSEIGFMGGIGIALGKTVKNYFKTNLKNDTTKYLTFVPLFSPYIGLNTKISPQIWVGFKWYIIGLGMGLTAGIKYKNIIFYLGTQPLRWTNDKDPNISAGITYSR